jgi:hypothetical protein
VRHLQQRGPTTTGEQHSLTHHSADRVGVREEATRDEALSHAGTVNDG